jgi:integrase
LRSWRAPQAFLKTLIENFGGKRVGDITHDDIEQFKLTRLRLPTRRGTQRSIASVNRELELMRAVMRFASRQGYIQRSPFETGAPLISKSDEVRRERVLTHDEESRLLAACTNRRAHLRPLLVCALDTGMRRGELFKLRWRDVDLYSREMTITAMNSKTARARIVGMTPRVYEALDVLRQYAPADVECLVFGITDTMKKSFAAACHAAGINAFRFHDCRHTAITRWIQAGVASMEVMKLSGHTQMNTFARYINPNTRSVRQASDALAAFNAQSSAQEVSTESIN